MLSIVNDVYGKELAKAVKKMEDAAFNNNKYEYDKHKKEIEAYHKKLVDQGVKLKPPNLPKWGGPSLRDLSTKPIKTDKPTRVLSKSVGKATEMVAGRTGKQIEAAKRAQTKRLGQSGAGGKSKRCKKGKSCGATCINSGKVCLVDIPWASAAGIPKVVKEIQGRKKEPAKKVEPKPAKQPKQGPKVKLDELNTMQQFSQKLIDTRKGYTPKIEEMHSAIRKLIGDIVGRFPEHKNDAEKKRFGELADKLAKRMGNGDKDKGESLIRYAYRALRDYTGSYSKEMRDAQFAAAKNPQGGGDPKYLKMAKVLEKLLNSPEVDKPAVEKFRGKRVDSTTLQGMVESAKAKGTFKGGALASWSTDLNISRDFADRETYDGRDQRVLLRAVNSRGVPVKALSSIDYEYEVLTPSTANYRYSNYRVIDYGGTKYHVFDVEES